MADSQRFLNDITSWYWWISVVLFTLAINLASAYLKEPLDKLLAKRSSTHAAQRATKEETRHLHAQWLAENPGLLALEIRNESQSILCAILSMATASVACTLVTAAQSIITISDTPLKLITMSVITYTLFAVATFTLVTAVRYIDRALQHAERIAYVRQYSRTAIPTEFQ